MEATGLQVIPLLLCEGTSQGNKLPKNAFILTGKECLLDQSMFNGKKVLK